MKSADISLALGVMPLRIFFVHYYEYRIYIFFSFIQIQNHIFSLPFSSLLTDPSLHLAHVQIVPCIPQPFSPKIICADDGVN